MSGVETIILAFGDEAIIGGAFGTQRFMDYLEERKRRREREDDEREHRAPSRSVDEVQPADRRGKHAGRIVGFGRQGVVQEVEGERLIAHPFNVFTKTDLHEMERSMAKDAADRHVISYWPDGSRADAINLGHEQEVGLELDSGIGLDITDALAGAADVGEAML